MSQNTKSINLPGLIKAVDIFSSLGSGEVDFIAANSSPVSHAPDELIFSQGDPGNALYIVVSGEIGIVKQSAGATDQRIAELIAGDCFGELDLLTNAPRTASAKAISQVSLLRFPATGQVFETLMENQPVVAAKLLRSLLTVIAGRTRQANSLIKENSPLVRELRQQVYGDKLSGLNNRLWLEENLPSLCVDRKRPFAVLMFKPDNFKAINDSYGHEAGDRTIILMAADLKQFAEASQLTPFRFAGNELGLTLPGVERTQALTIATALQTRLGALDLSPALLSGDAAAATAALRPMAQRRLAPYRQAALGFIPTKSK